jgi:hypothetical protein
MFSNGVPFKKSVQTFYSWKIIKKWRRIQDEILYALPEECKSYKGLELDGFHIRVWYYLLVVLFRQAAPLPDMSCTNPDHPSRLAFQGWDSVISHPCGITRRLRKVCHFQYIPCTQSHFSPCLEMVTRSLGMTPLWCSVSNVAPSLGALGRRPLLAWRFVLWSVILSALHYLDMSLSILSRSS